MKQNSIFHIFIFFLVAFAIFSRKFLSPGIAWWADMTPPVLNMSVFNDIANFLYIEKNSGLIFNPIYILLYFFLHKFFYILSLFVSLKLLTDLWAFIPYLVAYLTVYYCFNQLLNKKSISFLLTLLYILSSLNFSWIAAGWSTTTYSQASGFLFFTFVVKYLKKMEIKYIIFASLTTITGFMNIAYFYAIMLILSIFIAIYFITNKINLKSIITRYKTSVLFIPITLLINAYWLIPYIPMLKLDQISLDNNIYISTYKITSPFNNFRFASTFNSFPNYQKIFSVFNSPLYILIHFIILALVLWYFFVQKKIRDYSEFKYIFIVIFSLSLGPFFFIFWQALSFIPGWFLLRAPLIRFYVPLFFIFLLLIGFILKSAHKKLFVAILVFYLGLNIYGFIKGDIFNYWVNINLPNDYQQVIRYLNYGQRAEKTIFTLPEVIYNSQIKWVKNNPYWINILDSLLKNPLTITKWSRGRVPSYFYPFMDEKIGKGYIAKYIGRGEVKYIISQYDMLDLRTWSFEDIPGIHLLINGTNLKLYEVDNQYYFPRIYSDNKVTFTKVNPSKYTIKISSLSEQTKLVFNQPYNELWKLFPKKIEADTPCNDSESYLSTDSISCFTSTQFYEGDEVPFIWTKPLFEETHNQIYQYANQWIIDAGYIKNNFDSSYYHTNLDGTIDVEFTLFYTPQGYFYVGLAITGLMLFISIGYLSYDSLRGKFKRYEN